MPSGDRETTSSRGRGRGGRTARGGRKPRAQTAPKPPAETTGKNRPWELGPEKSKDEPEEEPVAFQIEYTEEGVPLVYKMELDKAGLEPDPQLSPAERSARLDRMDEELRRQQTSGPKIPPSNVPDLPPPGGQALRKRKITPDMDPDERARAEQENIEVELESKRLQRSRNKESQTLKRKRKDEMIFEFYPGLLSVMAAELRWFRLEAAARGVDLDKYDSEIKPMITENFGKGIKTSTLDTLKARVIIRKEVVGVQRLDREDRKRKRREEEENENEDEDEGDGDNDDEDGDDDKGMKDPEEAYEPPAKKAKTSGNASEATTRKTRATTRTSNNSVATLAMPAPVQAHGTIPWTPSGPRGSLNSSNQPRTPSVHQSQHRPARLPPADLFRRLNNDRAYLEARRRMAALSQQPQSSLYPIDPALARLAGTVPYYGVNNSNMPPGNSLMSFEQNPELGTLNSRAHQADYGNEGFQPHETASHAGTLSYLVAPSEPNEASMLPGLSRAHAPGDATWGQSANATNTQASHERQNDSESPQEGPASNVVEDIPWAQLRSGGM